MATNQLVSRKRECFGDSDCLGMSDIDQGSRAKTILTGSTDVDSLVHSQMKRQDREESCPKGPGNQKISDIEEVITFFTNYNDIIKMSPLSISSFMTK